MENKKTIALAALVAIIVTLGVGYFTTPAAKVPPVGSVVSDTIDGASFSVGGVRRWFKRYAFSSASTTQCVLQTPPATTTLTTFAVKYTQSTSTAKVIYMAKGAAMQASTTVLYTDILASNALGTFYASTTVTGSLANANNSVLVIAPNSWLNVSKYGGQGPDSESGVCEYVLTEI